MTDTMARRDSRPANKLRFMQPQEFEDEAAQLLAEYGHKHGMVTAPPVPVDEIVEHGHMKRLGRFRHAL